MLREGSARLSAETAGTKPASIASLSPADDARLVAAVASGDREALASLYDFHAPALLALARRMLKGPAAAEDLVHDVFLEAWHHAGEYSPERGSVRAWLAIRTRSRALDRLGKSARDARLAQRASDPGGNDPPPSAAVTIDAARVRRLASELPEELATVLDLAYFEGLSCSEIAERANIPIGTVKSRMARALSLLRRSLVPEGAEP